VDVEKQVQYWRESAVDDLEAATLLFDKGKVNQGLFFAHLALEKALKAVVCRAIQSTPPLTHNLPKLADCSGIPFTADQRRFLARVSRFQIRGRYELPARPLISRKECPGFRNTVEETVQWLINQ